MFKSIKDSAGEFKSLQSIVAIAMLLAIHTVLSLFVSVRVSDSLKISTGFIATAIMAVCYGPVVGFIFGALGDIIQYLLNPTGPLALGLTLNAALAAMVYGFVLYKKLPKDNTGENVDKKRMSKAMSWILGIISAALIMACFVMLLLAYTDRKTKTYSTGFFVIAGICLVAGIVLTVILIKKTRSDVAYMLRVVACVSFINVVINAVLGTYWLAQLYAWDYGIYFVPRLIKNLIQIPINSVIIYYIMKAFAANKFLRGMAVK